MSTTAHERVTVNTPKQLRQAEDHLAEGGQG
jgi:hypothetical protein